MRSLVADTGEQHTNLAECISAPHVTTKKEFLSVRDEVGGFESTPDGISSCDDQASAVSQLRST